MKKIILVMLFFCFILPMRAEKVNQVVFLDTSVEEAEKILLNLIHFYEGKIQLTSCNKENHIYTVNYNILNPYGLYNNGINTNVNVVNTSQSKDVMQNNNKSQEKNYAYGGYSC